MQELKCKKCNEKYKTYNNTSKDCPKCGTRNYPKSSGSRTSSNLNSTTDLLNIITWGAD